MSSIYDEPRPLVSFSRLIRRRAPRHCAHLDLATRDRRARKATWRWSAPGG